jgi:hypothetical protein
MDLELGDVLLLGGALLLGAAGGYALANWQNDQIHYLDGGLEDILGGPETTEATSF